MASTDPWGGKCNFSQQANSQNGNTRHNIERPPEPLLHFVASLCCSTCCSRRLSAFHCVSPLNCAFFCICLTKNKRRVSEWVGEKWAVRRDQKGSIQRARVWGNCGARFGGATQSPFGRNFGRKIANRPSVLLTNICVVWWASTRILCLKVVCVQRVFFFLHTKQGCFLFLFLFNIYDFLGLLQ